MKELHDLESALQKAKASSRALLELDESKRNAVLCAMADSVLDYEKEILESNAQDLSLANALPVAMRKRLELDSAKLRAMAESVREIAALPAVVGRELRSWRNENNLLISQISVPLGVIGVIYESRPNVTSDVGALCFKSGNVCVLKGGKEAQHSNRAIHTAMQEALRARALPLESITMLSTREAVEAFLTMDSYVDLLIPRGGEGLIDFVKRHATIPIIKHDKGVCHTYIHKSADLAMAQKIVLNAKLSYPAACNACECVLLDRELGDFAKTLIHALHSYGVRVMLEDEASLKELGAQGDGLADYTREWGDAVINFKIVENLECALSHIARYGSQHSEAIVASDEVAQERFLREVDAACVYVNASTRFSDGGVFGFGAEIGISTSKLHARGPMGIQALQSYKYCIRGNGEVRG